MLHLYRLTARIVRVISEILSQNNQKNVLWRNPLNNYDALGGSAPAAKASPDCDCAVLPVRNRGEISNLSNTEESLCAPAPNGGRAGARGAIVT